MSSRAILFTAVSGAALAAALTFGCTSILGDFDVSSNPPHVVPDAGKDKGAACTTGTECGTGQCVDGVCCEAACDGVCEKCNLPGTEGTCAPVPDGQNPDNECPSEPLPSDDAGAPTQDLDAGDAGDAGDDGGFDAGPSDAGPVDAGLPFNFPDGGATTDQNQCAGSCNGQRACKYPGTDRTCGTVSCGNTVEQGRASCDGKGRCLFGIEECKSYTCPDGNAGCKTSCAGPTDCQDGFYCDGASNTCKARLNDGAGCASDLQCGSGYCVSGVCCNDPCNYPGASCALTGKVGQCACSQCPTGTCALYYRDADNDGYGDMNATFQNGLAVPACAAGPAPPGYVANKDDCYDVNDTKGAFVNPGQTGWFNAPYGPNSSYDYDCSGTPEKETPEFIGASCHYCSGTRFSICNTTTACSTVGQQSGLGCTYSGKFFVCTADTRPGFTSAVNCGSSGFRYTCGTCNGMTITGTTGSTQTQRCH